MSFPARFSFPSFSNGLMPFGQQPMFMPAPGSFGANGMMPRMPPMPPAEKPPPSTAFVGNIIDKCTNDLIRALLQECGDVVSWQRIQGTNGKFQAFGYCKFEHPDSTLRALRVLHDLSLGGKKLVVKVDDNARSIIRAFIEKRRADCGIDPLDLQDGELPHEPEMMKSDEELRARILAKIKAEAPELLPVEDGEISNKSPTLHGKGGNLDIEGLDREKKEYIHDEIRRFRQQHQDEADSAANNSADKNVPCSGATGTGPRDRGRARPKHREMASTLRDAPSADEDELYEDDRHRRERDRDSRPPSTATNRSVNSVEVLGEHRSRSRSVQSSKRSTSRKRALQSPSELVPVSSQSQPSISQQRAPSPAVSHKSLSSTSSTRSRSKSQSAGRSSRSSSSSRSTHSTRSPPPKKGKPATQPSKSRATSRPLRRGRTRSRSRSRSSVETAGERRARHEREYALQKKTKAYDERLDKWERRERKKQKEYDRYFDEQRKHRKEMKREAKKLKEFLEDYDDDRDDPKYYKKSALFQRRRDFEREREADLRDRQQEQEQLEEMRLAILKEGVATDRADEELNRRVHNNEMKLLNKQRADSDSPPHRRLGEPVNGAVVEESSSDDEVLQEDADDADMDVQAGQQRASSSECNTPVNAKGVLKRDTAKEKHRDSPGYEQSEPSTSHSAGTGTANWTEQALTNQAQTGAGTGTTPASPGAPPPASTTMLQQRHSMIKQTLAGIFGDDIDDDDTSTVKKPLPVPEKTAAEEKKERVRALIDSIPTVKEELFAYDVDWSQVDEVLIKRRMMPWINKKIEGYIGEAEPTLTKFVADKLLAKCTPAQMLSDIAMVLDDEAEVFVVKLWRLVIYESEARKAGLVKLSD